VHSLLARGRVQLTGGGVFFLASLGGGGQAIFGRSRGINCWHGRREASFNITHAITWLGNMVQKLCKILCSQLLEGWALWLLWITYYLYTSLHVLLWYDLGAVIFFGRGVHKLIKWGWLRSFILCPPPLQKQTNLWWPLILYWPLPVAALGGGEVTIWGGNFAYFCLKSCYFAGFFSIFFWGVPPLGVATDHYIFTPYKKPTLVYKSAIFDQSKIMTPYL
jgi:hypothetical protein